ncbi:hypothetical protein Tco_0989342 [Tanacetum coccineum]|uniref:Uncharacterized protein n=1 Tax=Tanacetum coccineum TaxID=301880 RepID=A0ABQ5EU36_9ASTR
MKRGFRGAPRPLLPAMLLVATTNPNAGQEHHDVAQSQPSSSTLPVPSTSSPPVQSPPPIPTSIPASTPTPIPATIPTPTPIPDTEPEPFEHTFEEPSPVYQHFSPPQEQAHGQMTVNDLLQLVKKVKKLEGFLKRRNVIFSDSKEEEPEAQGRKSQDDPLVSLVQGLVTPSTTNVNASGEEQVEDISPNTLEAAKTLSGSLITAEGVSTGSTKRSIPSPDKGQRAGKAPMIIEEAPKKSKEQILQEEASLLKQSSGYLQNEDVLNQSKEEFDKLVKQIGKERLHTDLDKDEFLEDFKKLSVQDDSVSDDLTELYRIVMNRYGMDGPEDELEKVFWKYLKNMFEEPLSTDPIWSLLDKKLQGGKPDEDCYKMLKMMEKQAGIRK